MNNGIKEGDVYKVITIDDKSFEIRYGYETPEEKIRGWEPTPIFPDFEKNPEYTKEGCPIVTVYQNVCKHYKPKVKKHSEKWCENCNYFESKERYMGICKCKERLREVEQNE